MPLVSVIVPVYKAEKWLHRCVDSILAQTMEDFELLLIDDGSPDRSGEICDEYAAKDSRVRVFHKENGGVSSARQVGIDNALGEYTIHADPDDWVESTMLEELYAKAKVDDADMVICDYYEYTKKGEYLRNLKLENLEPSYLLKKMLREELHGSTCNKLIRRSCYCKYNIKFPLNISLWEDLFVICNFLRYPINISYLSKGFYHYDMVINENSIVRKPTMQSLRSQMNFIDYFSNVLDCKEYGDEFYKCKLSIKSLAWKSRLLSDKEAIELYSEINERYITEVRSYIKKTKNLPSFLIGLSITLKGYPRFGRFIYYLLSWLKPKLRKLLFKVRRKNE